MVSHGISLKKYGAYMQTRTRYNYQDYLQLPEDKRYEIIDGDLLVEIRSPSTSMRDTGIKKKLYARHGVREYWIVDPAREMLDVFRLQGREFESKRYGVQDFLCSSAINDLSIEVKEIFV